MIAWDALCFLCVSMKPTFACRARPGSGGTTSRLGRALRGALLWWLALAGLVGAVGLQAGEPGRAPFTRDVYVWQRQFGPEVIASLQALSPSWDSCCVLAAEVAWTGAGSRITRLPVDHAALAALGRPIGLAVRINAFPGPFRRDDPTARRLAGLAAELLRAARAAGVKVAELQIDFDAAEAKLAGYREWLVALRTATGDTPLAFTALPVWLKHPEFRALAQAADAFVLQVHALEKPAGPVAVLPLCDPVRTIAWVQAAGRVGVPFRVALPTYGYVVAFDAAGKFLGLAAEGPRPAWPRDAVVRVVRAEAPVMSRLVRTLATTRPPGCTGVIWFRLPVASDRLNWDVTTLARVLRDEEPVPRWDLAIAWPEPGLAEIALVNTGGTTERPPDRVVLRWPEAARLLAGDGLGGFRLDARHAQGQATIAASALPPDAFLAPGRRLHIAWLRFPHEVPLDASVAASLPPP